MIKNLLLFSTMICSIHLHAQLFVLKKTYTGSHFAISRFDPAGLNQFVVGFNNMYRTDITTGFHQYKGSELNLTFTTSGFRVIFGKKEMKYTISTDYALGLGKDKNEAKFRNGTSQHLEVRCAKNQINATFGVTFNEEKLWLEAYTSTNIAKVIIEYTTEYPNGQESFGSEYKLNGLYRGNLTTTELGLQTSYKVRKFVFYLRAMYPIAIAGPGKSDRTFVDPANGHEKPNDFPANYSNYALNPTAYIANNGQLLSSNFKGFSFGFGSVFLFGKSK